MTEREYIHLLLMGKPGGGKSTLCSTFPGPLLVLSTDPPDKVKAYLDLGKPTGYQKGQYCYFREVFDKTDEKKLLARIEYWGESNPMKPTTYPRWMSRTASLEQDLEQGGFKTCILDTVTYFELMARCYSEMGCNQGVKDGRQHYAYSAHACEQYIMMRWPNLITCNSVVCAHIDDQKDETEGEQVVMRKMVAMPGKMPNRAGGGFGEVWRCYYAGKDKAGTKLYRVQTQPRTEVTYECKSLQGFPDPCEPSYNAIWAAWDAKKAA